jgi:hypothetical protein
MPWKKCHRAPPLEPTKDQVMFLLGRHWLPEGRGARFWQHPEFFWLWPWQDALRVEKDADADTTLRVLAHRILRGVA